MLCRRFHVLKDTFYGKNLSFFLSNLYLSYEGHDLIAWLLAQNLLLSFRMSGIKCRELENCFMYWLYDQICFFTWIIAIIDSQSRFAVQQILSKSLLHHLSKESTSPLYFALRAHNSTPYRDIGNTYVCRRFIFVIFFYWRIRSYCCYIGWESKR